MPRSQVIALLFFLLVLSSMISLSTAALPPDAREERCQESGGSWNGGCVCPEEATSLWGTCWLVTPKEACRRMGGRIEHEKGVVGPQGASFRCVRGGEEVTSLARARAVKYSQRKVEPKQPDQPVPPQETAKTEFAWWAAIAAIGLGLAVTLVLAKKAF